MQLNKIVISRSDGIGDVILTLPVAHQLKSHYPESEIIFIGKEYTKAIIECCDSIDTFIPWETETQMIGALKEINADVIFHVFPRKEIVRAAFKARIPLRIATARRLHTKLYCNKKLNFSRRKSELHEAQLNLKMLEALDLKCDFTIAEIEAMFDFKSPSIQLPKIPDSDRKRVFLHPKSHGSALEWPAALYGELAMKLSDDMDVFVTGTTKERELIGDAIHFENDHIHDLCGKLSLTQLIAAINKADALIACSTGPLHIAAALERQTLGLYSPKIPIHPGRWSPIGKNASFLVSKSHPENGQLPFTVDEVFQWIKNRV